MPSRTWVYWSSLALMIAGWGGSLWSWLDHGHAAGVNPGFIAALSVGIAFTIVWAMCAILPDLAKVYGIGHREGYAAGRAGVEQPRHLHAVR